MSFKAGEVVLVTRAGSPHHNKCGVVKSVKDITTEGIAVEFDEAIPGGHDLGGLSPANRGYYFSARDITKLEPAGEAMKNYYERQLQKKKITARNSEPLILIEESN